MRKTVARLRVGLGLSLASAFFWSTAYIGGRYLMSHNGVDPVTLSLLRFSVGGLLLFLVALLFFRKQLFKVGLKELGKLALLGAFGVAGMSLFFFMGQQSVSAITSSLIMALSPVMVFVLLALTGAGVSVKSLLGLVLSAVGCALVIGMFSGNFQNFFSGQSLGILLIFLSAVCWAVYTVLGKPTADKLGGLMATVWAMLFGALEILILYPFIPIKHIWPSNNTDWSVVLYIAVFPTAVAYLAWNQAAERIPLMLLNVMQYLSPAFTILLGWMILGESMTWLMILGSVMILAGVSLTHESVAAPKSKPR